MRDYELTYIIKPDVDATNVHAIIERISGFITAEGGSVTKLDQWGVRRLSYPINKYREGHYVFILTKLEADAVTKIEGRLRLQEDLLRYLVVKAEETGRPAPVAVNAAPDAAVVPAAVESTEAVAAVEAVPAVEGDVVPSVE